MPCVSAPYNGVTAHVSFNSHLLNTQTHKLKDAIPCLSQEPRDCNDLKRTAMRLYSYFKVFTGFIWAAWMVCDTMVNSAMIMVMHPATTNTQALTAVR